MSTSIGSFLTAVYNKLLTVEEINNETNRVYIGSDYPIYEDLSVDDFPRVEVLIEKDKMDGYISQRMLDWQFRFVVQGTMLFEEKDITGPESLDKTLTLFTFGVNIRKAIYGLLDDKQNGLVTMDNFLKFGSFGECFYDHLADKGVSQFVWAFEAHLETKDTES